MEKEKLKKLKAGICYIEVERGTPVDYEQYGSFTGTGFLMQHPISKRKVVVTCKHLATMSCRSVAMEFANGFRAKGKVIYNDHSHDISFIDFEDPENLVDAEIFEIENEIEEFDSVTLIGSNEGYKSFSVNGIIAETHFPLGPRHTIGIQTNLACSNGTSGAPVFNDQGKLIGMHIQGTDKCSFEIRIEVVMDVLDKFFNSRPRFESGITFQYMNKYTLLDAGLISSEEDSELFLNVSNVLAIKDIDFFYDGHSKLMPGDLIIMVNGIRSNDPFEVDQLIDLSKDLVQEITFMRSGKVNTCQIVAKLAKAEITHRVALWEEATFQDTNIHTRRYYSIREEGVLLSKCGHASPLLLVGAHSQVVAGGKAALITHIDGERVRNLSEFHDVIARSKNASILIHYYDYMNMSPLQIQICEVRSRDLKRLDFFETNLEVASIEFKKCS